MRKQAAAVAKLNERKGDRDLELEINNNDNNNNNNNDLITYIAQIFIKMIKGAKPTTNLSVCKQNNKNIYTSTTKI